MSHVVLMAFALLVLIASALGAFVSAADWSLHDAHAAFPGVNDKIASGVSYSTGNDACGGGIIFMNEDGTEHAVVPQSVRRGSSPSFSPPSGPIMSSSSNMNSSIDRIAPDLAVSFPLNGSLFHFSSPSSSASIVMRGTAFDFGSGIEKVEVRVDSGAFHKASGNLTWKYSIDPSLLLSSEGVHNITVRATDIAGNIATYNLDIVVYLTKSTVSIPTHIKGNVAISDRSSSLELSVHEPTTAARSSTITTQ
jgi:hypothetical protein